MQFTHVKTTIPSASQLIKEGTRFYKTPEGKHYPSITTILSKTSDMTRLEEWRKEQGYAVADHIMREAGDRGTITHEMCEDYLNNKPSKSLFPLICQAHFHTLYPYLDRINNIRGLEIALYSDEYQMAGTADCIAEYDEKLSVIDFKTSRSRLVESYDKVQKYFMQASAYALMWKERTGITINQIVVLGSEEGGGFSEFIKDPKIYESDLFEKLEKFKLLQPS